MPRGRPPKENKLSNAERKARHRAKARAGGATAEAIDAALLNAFKDAYARACFDTVDYKPTVWDLADEVVSKFDRKEGSRVRARLGMPINDGSAWEEQPDAA